MAPKKGLLKRLDEGVVLGDGGFVFALEKRGYVKAGPWTPEAVLEHPEAVKGLHREFLRAGSDVMQAFTFYASDDKLSNRGNTSSKKYTCSGINKAACELARAVADEDPEQQTLVAGGLSETPTYLSMPRSKTFIRFYFPTDAGKEAVQAEFKTQVDAFVESKVDFLIAEYFEYVEEMEWAIEVCRGSGLPVVASMCIGPEGDMHGVSAGDCAVRMAKAGAHVVGVNCHFDPFVSLEAIRLMKAALDAADLHPHLIVQPLAYLTPDAKKQGFIDLPEFPFGLEPRLCTRWDMHKFARAAYELGVRYIGGCCGFEAYHVRALAEELQEYFEYVEEMEWAIEVCRGSGLPVVASMCIGPEGDMHGVSAGDCAVRMAKAGAHVVGVNCHFDPFVSLEAIRLMKAALDAADLHPHLIVQPLAYLTPDAKKQGFIDLPEFPFGTWRPSSSIWGKAHPVGRRLGDAHEALGQSKTLGRKKTSSSIGLNNVTARRTFLRGVSIVQRPHMIAGRDYWEALKPATGRPYNPSMSCPDQWGVVQGSEELQQKSTATTQQEIAQLKERAKTNLQKCNGCTHKA
ncbi:Homocysteine-binding domain [Trinorchestia longiramus]|nr:Homocysteine-binding domain [Trinorchestia longiramus]